MGKLIIIYFDKHVDLTEIEYPDTEAALEKRCQELLAAGYEITCAAKLKMEYRFEPVEKVVIYRMNRIDQR